MANGREIAPVRKLIAAVLGTVATFVILFGAGMTSWTIVALGAALLVLAIALVAMTAVRTGARAWVTGQAHVHQVSEPPAAYAFGRCELQIVIDAPGLPPRSVKVIDPRVPVAKWPDPGQTLPIKVAIDDQRHVRILWDEVPTHAERAAMADLPPEFDDYDPLGDDFLIEQDTPPWMRRGPDDDYPLPPAGEPVTADLTDDLGSLREDPVVMHHGPGGTIVLEGTLVEPTSAAPLPRRPSPGPYARREQPATAPDPVEEQSATAAGPVVGTAAGRRPVTPVREQPVKVAEPAADEPAATAADPGFEFDADQGFELDDARRRRPRPGRRSRLGQVRRARPGRRPRRRWSGSVRQGHRAEAEPSPGRHRHRHRRARYRPPRRGPAAGWRRGGGSAGRRPPIDGPIRRRDGRPRWCRRPAAGLGPISGVGITLLVTHLDTSVAFYRDMLGFFEIDGGDGNAVLASGATRLVLRSIPEVAPINRRLVHLNLEVADVKAAYAELKDKGVKFTYAPRVVNRGERLELWAAAFRDPDGHGIALTQWRADRPSDPDRPAGPRRRRGQRRITRRTCRT